MSDGPSLTRREALVGAAAVAGAGVLRRPGDARAAAPPTAPVLWRDLGTLRAGVTAPIRVARPFCLVAVGWSAPAAVGLQLRTRRADGSFGAWGAAVHADGIDPVGGSGVDGTGSAPGRGARVGEPMWVGRATELQLRSRGTVRGVRLAFVAAEDAAGHGDAADGTGAGAAADLADSAVASTAALPRVTPPLPAGPGQPAIIARRAWAGTTHPPVAGPFYGTVEMGVVHHTENPNGYAAADVPAMLRAIYAFHVHGRGWFDIGYNFVVDRFGRVWEARQGGIDLPVQGAQAGDWNQISFGVAMLGTYTTALPSAPALVAVQHLIAWKLALSGVPVLGDVAAVVGSEGVGWTQFRVGEHVRFPRVAGHRDVDATDCPGDVLYRHLPTLRSQIAQLAGIPATLALDAALWGAADGTETVMLSGRLARDGSPIAAAPIAVQSVVDRLGDTLELAAATTDADGRFTATVPARDGLLLRALSAQSPAVSSALVAVGPQSAASWQEGAAP